MSLLAQDLDSFAPARVTDAVAAGIGTSRRDRHDAGLGGLAAGYGGASRHQ